MKGTREPVEPAKNMSLTQIYTATIFTFDCENSGNKRHHQYRQGKTALAVEEHELELG